VNGESENSYPLSHHAGALRRRNVHRCTDNIVRTDEFHDIGPGGKKKKKKKKKNKNDTPIKKKKQN
jgi:hypothetical protein